MESNGAPTDASAPLKRAASDGALEGGALKRARDATFADDSSLVVVIACMAYGRPPFGFKGWDGMVKSFPSAKFCVRARTDADATPLEQQCAEIRDAGTRNVCMHIKNTEYKFGFLGSTALQNLVKRLYFTDNEDLKAINVEQLTEFPVVREIPEGYFERLPRLEDEECSVTNVTAHLAKDAHVVCINIFEDF